MAGLSSSKPNQPITAINVTPLVDIMLVLLIIFMVTAKLVVSRGLDLDLPQGATSDQIQQVFSVALDEQGGRFVDGAPVTSDRALLALAGRAQKSNKELRAVIQAEGKVPHSRVMNALDVLRQAGVVRVAFAVLPGPPVNPNKATP